MFAVFRRDFRLRATVLPWLSVFVLPSVLALSACGDGAGAVADDTSSGGGPTSSSSETTPAPGSADSGTLPHSDPPKKECDAAQTAAVQASLAKSLPADIDVSAVVRDECGVRYFTSGPSKYPRTTLHRFASNTKTYVASLVILLVEDGVLDLDAPISKWIGNVPGGDSVHVRHLLLQTSGIYNYTDDQLFMASVVLAGGKKKWNPQDQINVSFKHPLAYDPGTSWNYSNANYTLLGMIIEKVTGKKVVRLIHERILDKIGVKNTFFPTSDAITGTLATGRGTFGDETNFTDPSFLWTAGEVVSTPEDLALWYEKRGSRQFHSQKGNALLFDEAATPDGHMKYGPAQMDYDATVMKKGGQAIGHGGDWFGYHSYGFYFPARKTTIVAVVDSDAGPGGPGFPLGATHIFNALYGVLDGLFPNPAP